ncbi:MAG TPA: hypothetical protein VIL48_08785 [Acidimicrobiales bacterium]
MRYHPHARGDQAGPWFQRHPRLAVGVAAGLFAVVFAVRLAVHETNDAILLLFVLPVALLAVAFGLRAGAAAGLLGVALLAVWMAVADVALSPLGWVARATPLLLLGVLLGAAADRLREAAEVERRLVLAEIQAREAAELHDSVIQRLAAAKWALEAGDDQRSIELLTESIETAEALVAELLDGDGDKASAARPSAAPPPAVDGMRPSPTPSGDARTPAGTSGRS